jgi:hypothetical protein
LTAKRKTKAAVASNSSPRVHPASATSLPHVSRKRPPSIFRDALRLVMAEPRPCVAIDGRNAIGGEAGAFLDGSRVRSARARAPVFRVRFSLLVDFGRNWRN